MILKNKKLLAVTSLLTLLPIPVGFLLWDRFPEQMVTHWGITGQPDGWSSPAFAVLFPPLILLATHWLCIFFTAKDPGNKGRNRKPLGMVLWIIPCLSNLSCGLMYALALGADVSVTGIMVAAMGLLFVGIGNYMPKMKMNSTMGIKVPWTYTSEENWNATHRFGGKIWVIGGFVMVLGALLPETYGVTVMILSLLVLTVIPVVYSWRYYRKQKAAGDALKPLPPKGKAGKAGVIALAVLLVFVAAVMFTGEIDFVFREEYLFVDTNMYSDHILYYDVIEAVEYREGNVAGIRVGGYGSMRLLMGYFENEEFGVYIRYTYYKPEACVVLTTDSRTVVLSGEDAAETRMIYEMLLEKTS